MTAYAAETPSRINYRFLAHPIKILALSLIFVSIGLSGIVLVHKDPSVDAFVPANHPAAIARDRAKTLFGLEDPMVIGLSSKDGQSLFTTQALEILRSIHEGVRTIDGVDKNDVVSLAGEKAIFGKDGELSVELVLPAGEIDSEAAQLAWTRFQAMPMFEGTLASSSGDLLTIIVPLEHPDDAQQVVREARLLANQFATENIEVHFSGVATMNATLAGKVDADTKLLVPAAITVVLLVLMITLRRPRGLIGPSVVIAGSAGFAIGTLGWMGAKYYLITTSLPVVIMAIAVADSLHISTYFLKARAEHPEWTARRAVEDALRKAWLPVFLTSVTTAAAFLGLTFGDAMKPISEFGLFAAVGVVAACVLSFTALPAVLILTDLRPSRKNPESFADRNVERVINAFTHFSFRRPMFALAGIAILSTVLITYASRAEFDYERQRYFTENDPVRISDHVINDRLGGINFLDVIVSSPEPGGLMTPQSIAAIAELRGLMSDLPLVSSTTGIDQYMSLMHEVLTDAPSGALPTKENAPAQYMFLYESSGAPEDFKQEIDYEHQHALLRAQLSSDRYTQTQPIVVTLEAIAHEWSKRTGLDAAVSGRVAVNDGWMTQLSNTHYRSIGVAILIVLAATVIVFRSALYGVIAMAPVCFGIVSVYATMGAFNIDIAPATSMTAAIATGLGVDFGVHLISHIRKAIRRGLTAEEAFRGSYAIVARACVYSAIALGVGLAVTSLSSAPPLRWFGTLVSVGAFGSLFGVLIVLPALWGGAARLKMGS